MGERLTDDKLFTLICHCKSVAQYEEFQLDNAGGSPIAYTRAVGIHQALMELRELRAAAHRAHAVLFEALAGQTTREHIDEAMSAIEAELSGHRNEDD